MATADLVGCPHCGRPITYSRELSGQIIGCPHCGGKLQMPVRGPAPTTTQYPQPQPQMQPLAPVRQQTFNNVDEAPVRRRKEKEPWYYEVIPNYAKLFLWVAVLSLISFTVLIGYTVVKPYGQNLIAEQATRGVVMAASLGILTVLFMLLSIMLTYFTIAFLLLSTETAKNIRDQRTQPKE